MPFCASRCVFGCFVKWCLSERISPVGEGLSPAGEGHFSGWRGYFSGWRGYFSGWVGAEAFFYSKSCFHTKPYIFNQKSHISIQHTSILTKITQNIIDLRKYVMFRHCRHISCYLPIMSVKCDQIHAGSGQHVMFRSIIPILRKCATLLEKPGHT